jgi:hypothetical protein
LRGADVLLCDYDVSLSTRSVAVTQLDLREVIVGAGQSDLARSTIERASVRCALDRCAQ